MENNGVIFRTERLYIKKFRSGDLTSYAALESKEAVMRYISGRPRTFPESKKRFTGFVRNYTIQPQHTGVWGIYEKGASVYIGTASLNPLPNSDYYQIGYKLHPNAQGKGFATEVAKGLLKHAFIKAGLQKIAAVTDTRNSASQRVLLKAGMHRRGYHQAYGAVCTYFSLEKSQYIEGLQKRG